MPGCRFPPRPRGRSEDGLRPEDPRRDDRRRQRRARRSRRRRHSRLAGSARSAGRRARPHRPSTPTVQVVAPGFVDIHTHYDAQVLWDRMLTISPWHGVTTVVIGNCGFGVAPTRPEHRGLILRTLEKVEGMSLEALEAGVGIDWPFETFPQYLDAVEQPRHRHQCRRRCIGHTPLRLYVMGEDGHGTRRDCRRDRADARVSCAKRSTPVRSDSRPPRRRPIVGYAGKPVPSRAAELKEIRSTRGGAGRRGARHHPGDRGSRPLLRRVRRARRRDRPHRLHGRRCSPACSGPARIACCCERSIELLDKGLPIVPQVSCRPLNVRFRVQGAVRLREPADLPARLGGRSRRQEAHLSRPGLSPRVQGERQLRRVRRALASARDLGVPDASPRSRSARWRRWRASAASIRSISLLDLALASDLQARFRMAIAQLRRGRRGRAAVLTGTRCSASPMPVRTRASCATRASRPICSATGCARRAFSPRAGGAHADVASGGGGRHHGSRPPRGRHAGRRRGIRSAHGRCRQAAARARPAGGCGPAGRRRERHRGGDRERHRRSGSTAAKSSSRADRFPAACCAAAARPDRLSPRWLCTKASAVGDLVPSSPSYPRKRVSTWGGGVPAPWIPAFAGMTSGSSLDFLCKTHRGTAA